MTESKRPLPLSPGRRERGSGLAWKSGLVASSVGAVLVGWALLGRLDAAPANTVAQIASPQPRVIVVQVPIPNIASSGTQQLVRQPAQSAPANAQAVLASAQAVSAPNALAIARPQVVMPAVPQRPVFQQPVTRTRGS